MAKKKEDELSTAPAIEGKTSQQPTPAENPTTTDNLLEIENIELLSTKLSIQEITAKVDPVEEIPKDVLSTETTKRIIRDFAQKNQTTITNALIGITKLVQDGGTNSGKPRFSVTINEIKFDLGDLRNIIKLHTPEGTVRKLAKTLRETIAYIAVTNSWSGPLYKELQRQDPTYRIEAVDTPYCCEIHTDNYSTSVPPKIREALQERERRLRETLEKRKIQIPKNKTKNKKNKK